MKFTKEEEKAIRYFVVTPFDYYYKIENDVCYYYNWTFNDWRYSSLTDSPDALSETKGIREVTPEEFILITGFL